MPVKAQEGSGAITWTAHDFLWGQTAELKSSNMEELLMSPEHTERLTEDKVQSVCFLELTNRRIKYTLLAVDPDF